MSLMPIANGLMINAGSVPFREPEGLRWKRHIVNAPQEDISYAKHVLCTFKKIDKIFTALNSSNENQLCKGYYHRLRHDTEPENFPWLRDHAANCLKKSVSQIDWKTYNPEIHKEIENLNHLFLNVCELDGLYQEKPDFQIFEGRQFWKEGKKGFDSALVLIKIFSLKEFLKKNKVSNTENTAHTQLDKTCLAISEEEDDSLKKICLTIPLLVPLAASVGGAAVAIVVVIIVFCCCCRK